MIDFSRFEVFSFDCYGTLIDWESGILAALRPILGTRGIAVTDEQILELYGELESEIESAGYQPYRAILRQVVDRMGKRLDFAPTDAERNCLVDSLGRWPAFGDTVEALRALKAKYRLAIISNVDDDLFALTNKTLQVDFDYVITAAQAGAYKPSEQVFHYALKKIGVDKERILHVAQSLFHDHTPAQRLGFTTVWIDRRRGKAGGGATPPSAVRPDAEFPDLKSLVSAMGL